MNIEAQLQALDEGSMLRERSVHAPCSIRERKVGMSASRNVCDAMPSRPMRMTCLTPRTPFVGCVARGDGKDAERCREEYGYTFHVVRD